MACAGHGERGAPPIYSPIAIETGLALRLVFPSVAASDRGHAAIDCRRGNREPLHLVFDEADLRAPQQPTPEGMALLGGLRKSCAAAACAASFRG